MAQYSLYDFPDIYDLVLRHPVADIKTEVRTMQKLLAQRGITQGRVLELACGTCTHGILLAQQGFSVAGIDLSPAMLAGARRAAARAGVELALYEGDILDFHLDAEPFDCVIFMSETFPLITGYEGIVRHFGSVRRHLRLGGLFIIDIDAHRHGVGTQYGVWGEKSYELDNGVVEVWHEDFPGDWVQGTGRLVMHCRIRKGDSVYETADDWRYRVDSPWHLELLLKTLPDWSLVGFYSWRDGSSEFANEAHYFMLLERMR